MSGTFVAAQVSVFAHEARLRQRRCVCQTLTSQRPPSSLDRRESAREPGGRRSCHSPTPRPPFQASYPDYATTHHLDELRASDYARLDRTAQVYVDYTGGGLYAESQVRTHMDLLRTSVLGNPHSTNPTSRAMTQLVEQARAYVLEFFHASADEYVVIFTQNASGALKLVGESYPFGPDDRYLLTFDNHNSVNGIREFARAKGAEVIYAPVIPPDMYIDADKLMTHLEQARPDGHNLFAYPAQSNFSGVQHALEWIERAQASGWDVLLDAAAFVPTNMLDLTQWHPDFVTLSFYKMFGYPTGVGCLLARKAALAKLHRPWFAGGTITVASVQGDRYYLHEGGEAFEDGTLNYLALPAVEIGLRHIAAIGLDTIHTRVHCLTDWLLCMTELPPSQQWRAVDPCLWAGGLSATWRHSDAERLRSQRTVHRSPASGAARESGKHLAAYGLLL